MTEIVHTDSQPRLGDSVQGIRQGWASPRCLASVHQLGARLNRRVEEGIVQALVGEICLEAAVEGGSVGRVEEAGRARGGKRGHAVRGGRVALYAVSRHGGPRRRLARCPKRLPGLGLLVAAARPLGRLDSKLKDPHIPKFQNPKFQNP